MDLSFKWRNTSVNMTNSLGLNNIIHDVYENDQSKYELVDTTKLSDNTTDANHLVNLEDKHLRKKPKAKSVPKSSVAHAKINIFKPKF